MTALQTESTNTYRFVREICSPFSNDPLQPYFLFIAAESIEYIVFVPASRTVASFDLYTSDWKGSKIQYTPILDLPLTRIRLNNNFFATEGSERLLEYLDRIGYEEPVLAEKISNGYNGQSTLEFDQ